MRYRPEDVVAILDSHARPATPRTAFPSSRTVAEAQQYEPTTALVGVATQGGRFPPAWRELLKEAIRAGLDLENGLHEFVSNDPELVELAREHGVELRDLRKPPPGLNVPTGANLTHGATTILTVGSDCAIGKMTVSLELDREARRRGDQERVRPDRPDRDRDRRLGDLRRCRRRRLHRRRGRAARARGSRARRRGAASSRARARCSTRATPGVTLGLIHGSAPHAYVLCHKAGERFVDEDERFPIPPLSRARRPPRADEPPRPSRGGARGRAEHARPGRGGRPARRSRKPRRRPGCRPTTRSGSGPGSSSTLSNALREVGRAESRGIGRAALSPGHRSGESRA